MSKGFFNSLFGEPEPKSNSAKIAKERLQVIVATRHLSERLPLERIDAMKQEVLAVVNRYIAGVQMDDVTISQRKENDVDVLEMNVNLPERV